MIITLIGLIVIILSIIAFFRDEDKLLELTIFFSVFTAAAVLDTTATVSSAMTPFKVPMLLWLLKQGISFLKFLPKLNINIIKDTLKNNKIFTALLIFAITIILSVVWLFISGINYPYYDSLYSEDASIEFRMSNVKQAIGILLYFVFAMILSIKIKSREQIKRLLKIFTFSTMFAVIWGFVQFGIYYMGIEYPAFLFNNNTHYAQCYDQIMHGIKRISSVATEPSVFALNLLAAFPIPFIMWLYGKKSLGKKSNNFLRVSLVSMIICIILTTSSTALIGITVEMLVLLVFFITHYVKNNDKEKNKDKTLQIIVISVVSIIIALVIAIGGNRLYREALKNNPELSEEQREDMDTDGISNALKEMTIGKMDSGSGQERLKREKLGLEIYLVSPIFGVGFGSFRTFSLFTNIFTNMGIIGLIGFLYVMFVVFKQMIINRKKDEEYFLIFFVSIIGMLVAFFVSIPDLIYIYFWMILVFAYKYFEMGEEMKKDYLTIGIDARGLDQNRTGITTYIEETLKRIVEIDKKNKYILYSSREIKIDLKPNDRIIIKNCQKKKGTLWLYFDLPKMLSEDGVDIFWGTQHLLPMRNSYTNNIKYILTVHDLAIHKLKTVGELKNTIIQRLFLKTSCKHADIIMADSESTKQDIVELFKIKEEKIKTVYLGTNFTSSYSISESLEKDILRKFNVEDRNYLFFISTIEPRKNIITLIKAFEYLKENGYEKLKLILAGGLGWKYEPILEAITNSKYKDDINQAGYISKEEKECLLHNTKCFVYPSLYEGFGLPILEAMANEAIVVTSNISSIPEVGGDAAIYFDDIKNPNSLADAIINVFKLSDDEKKVIVEKGKKQVDKFSWDGCANGVLNEITKLTMEQKS